MLKRINESYIAMILIFTIIVWISSTIIDMSLTQEKMIQSKSFPDLLIFDIPEMLLFHRILYILIAAFIT